MSDDTIQQLQPGQVIHVLSPSWNIRLGGIDLAPIADVLQRGQVVVVTQAMIDLNPWLSVIDPEEQVRRFGHPVFGIGEWPEGLPTWSVYGSPEWSEQHDAARRDALARGTLAERDAALRKVARQFGKPLPTSRTLQHVTGDDR